MGDERRVEDLEGVWAFIATTPSGEKRAFQLKDGELQGWFTMEEKDMAYKFDITKSTPVQYE